jgi:hypothetical protein
MASEVQLFKDMLEQVVSGDGISGAATLAVGISPAKKAAIISHAEIFKHTPGLPPDVKVAITKIIQLLKGPPTAIKAAAKGNNTKLYLLGGAGLVAVWFFFIRKP